MQAGSVKRLPSGGEGIEGGSVCSAADVGDAGDAGRHPLPLQAGSAPIQPPLDTRWSNSSASSVDVGHDMPVARPPRREGWLEVRQEKERLALVERSKNGRMDWRWLVLDSCALHVYRCGRPPSILPWSATSGRSLEIRVVKVRPPGRIRPGALRHVAPSPQ